MRGAKIALFVTAGLLLGATAGGLVGFSVGWAIGDATGPRGSNEMRGIPALLGTFIALPIGALLFGGIGYRFGLRLTKPAAPKAATPDRPESSSASVADSFAGSHDFQAGKGRSP